MASTPCAHDKKKLTNSSSARRARRFPARIGRHSELLKRMKPDNIRDLIATNALYRPGPLSGGMVDSYVNRNMAVKSRLTCIRSWKKFWPRRTDSRLSRAVHAHPQPARRHRAGPALCLHQGDFKKKEDIINARPSIS